VKYERKCFDISSANTINIGLLLLLILFFFCRVFTREASCQKLLSQKHTEDVGKYSAYFFQTRKKSVHKPSADWGIGTGRLQC